MSPLPYCFVANREFINEIRGEDNSPPAVAVLVGDAVAHLDLPNWLPIQRMECQACSVTQDEQPLRWDDFPIDPIAFWFALMLRGVSSWNPSPSYRYAIQETAAPFT